MTLTQIKKFENLNDISCLYEFHHEYMLPLYREKCKIMYADIDSLIYNIECDDIYDIMKRDITKFDTSDYPIDNAYGIPLVNKKSIGSNQRREQWRDND